MVRDGNEKLCGIEEINVTCSARADREEGVGGSTLPLKLIEGPDILQISISNTFGNKSNFFNNFTPQIEYTKTQRLTKIYVKFFF